jgi:hypothetical protein
MYIYIHPTYEVFKNRFCPLACLGIAPWFEIEPAFFLCHFVVQLNESILAESRDGAAGGRCSCSCLLDLGDEVKET